jgi:hypothetical protein
MTAPEARLDPPYVADEMTMLRAYLDYHRATFRWKAGGLSPELWSTPHPPSTLTPAGLVKHLALVEDWWFSVNLAGAEDMDPFGAVDFDADPDWEFRTANDEDPGYVIGLWETAVAAADAHLAAAGGPDALAARPSPRTGEPISVRWIVLHMIEEYARHNGHLDLVREALDGLTGE